MSQVLDSNDKQKREKAKPKYEPIDFYQKNTYVDCKDSVNAWCVARILERCDDDSTLRINFDGWSRKWDEWVRFTSTRLAPFRKYSQGIGYTGQNKFAIRDWKFSVQELKSRTERLKEMIAANFTTLRTPFQITQCLRGSEFIYVDCLLEHEYHNPKEELPYVFQHLEACFQLYITFLKLIPDYIQDYLEGISNLDSFLTNDRIALILSINEVNEIINSIFGMSERLWGNFKAYDVEALESLITTPEEHAGKDITTEWTGSQSQEDNDIHAKRNKKYSKLICKLINKFASLGGIDAWIKAFTFYQSSEENTNNPNYMQLLPFRMMEVLLKTFSNIYGYINKDITDNLMPTIKSTIVRRLQYISERELKELDRDDFSRFIARAQNLLLQYYPKDEVFILTETAELDLDLKFLTCSFFEKRLRGINGIKELAEKIDAYERFSKNITQSSSNGYSPSMQRQLGVKTFINWIFKNKIFDLILGDSIHIEIIKRTHEILKFIGKYEKIPLDLLDLLWNSCEGKHEAILIGLYDTIVEISGFLDQEGVSFMRKRIESIPDEQQNETTLNLIKGFAENTLPRASEVSFDKDDNVDETKYNCLNTLWHLMLDESKVSIVLSENALNSLATLLKDPVCQPLRKVYLFRCFEKVKNRDSVSQCINLIHSILTNQYYNTRYESKSSLSTILNEINENFGLIELLVSEFEHFYHHIAEIVKKTHPENEVPEELREKSLMGKYSYAINFNNRLVFLDYLVTNSAYELTFTLEQIERLWNLLILKPIWNIDREYFFQWVSFRYEGQVYIRPVYVISKALIRDFFDKILSNDQKMDFTNLSPKAFECFLSYFKAINEQEGKFKVDNSLKFYVIDLNYEGKEALWEIFLKCKNEKTVKSILNLMVECNLQFGTNLEKKKKEVWENFTYKCINLLKEGYDNHNDGLISKAVFILMHFFDRFEGKNRLEIGKEDNSRYGYSIRVTAILKPENTMKSVIVNSHQTIGYLKGLIADKMGLLVDELEFTLRGKQFENDVDSSPIFNFAITEPFVVQRIQANKGHEGGYHPKQLIAENIEYIDLLFQLLSQDLQAVNIIWDLLMRLPVSKRTKTSLYEISDSWDVLLGAKSIHQHKLLYCLQIIEGFLFDHSYEKPKPVNKDTKEDATFEFKDHIWETFNKAFENDTKKAQDEIAQKVIDIINNVSEYSLTREHKDAKFEYSSQPFVKVYSKNNDEIIRIPEDQHFESEVVFYAQSFFLQLVQHNPTLLNHIYNYPNLKNMLSIGLVDSRNYYLKEKLSQGLLNLMTEFSKANISPLPHHVLVPILLEDTLHKGLANEEKSEVFFRMLTSLINHINIGEVDLDSDDLLSQLIEFLKLRKPMEKNQRDLDVVLHGVLLLLKGLFARYPDKAQKYSQEEDLVIEILQNCLFEIPRRVDRKEVPGPKCKNPNTRAAAFKLIAELSRGNDFNLQGIIDYITPIHQYGKWRTARYSDWNIVPKENEKSSTGYVGLKNLGCICYMISTIQQLYMIPSFRNSVLDVEDKHYNTTAKEDNILYQLKCIFAALNESEKQYFNPKDFCIAFKDWDGNPTNVFEQMDADEFFLLFLDRLEGLIKGTKQENFIKQHFGGVLSNELICKGCPHYKEREEPFLAVSLQVKNKKNIYQSLAAFVEGEMLEGDNAFLCDECSKKVNTLKRVCLKKLPNHLILVLKRFEFDYETMTKAKVNDYCEFPTKLDMEPYTQQGLKKAEKAKQNEKKEGEPDNKEQEATQDDYPRSYYEYKLTGIVIHMGFADSGHYISLIQDRELLENPEDQRWYEFNDTDVRYFDPKEIPSEAFGGEEKWRQYSIGQNMSSYREKIKNAYLLFYERIVPYEEPTQVVQQATTQVVKKEEFKEDQEEQSSFSTASTEKPPSHFKMIRSDRAPGIYRRLELEPKISDDNKKHYPNEFIQGILEKNQIFHIHRNVFSKEYFDFIQEVVMQRQFTPNLKYTPNEPLTPENSKEYYDFELIKLGLIFLLTAILRDKMRTNIIKFLPFIREKLAENMPACLWLIEQFSSKKVQLEFLLNCPIPDMRRFALGVVVLAFKTVFNHQLKEGNEIFHKADNFQNAKDITSMLTNFVNCSINLIFEAKENGRDYTEFFRLFYEISTCGHQVVGYFISKKIIGRFMDFFYEGSSPLNEFFRDMSDVSYYEPEQVELGEPQEEKKKVRTAWEEYMLKKKDKQVVASYTAQKSYMWKTLCYLLLHCKVNPTAKKCEWQIGDYDFQVLQKEMTLLTPDSKFIVRVIDDAETKIGYRSVAKFYSYLCYENPEFTNVFMEAIKSDLTRSDTTTFRPPLKCFTTLITLKDSLSDYRLNDLLMFLTNLMNDSSIFYLEVDSFSTFLMKIGSRIDSVKEWLFKNKDSWSWIITWLKKHPTPPVGAVTQDHLKLQKRRPSIGMPTLHFKMDEFRAKTTIKLRRFEKMLEGEVEDQKGRWDLDDDLSEHNFVVGEKLDFDPMKNNHWYTAEVEYVLEEMIKLCYSTNEKEKEFQWISKDSPNIAPFNTMQAIQAQVEAEIARYLDTPNKKADKYNMNDQDTDHEEGYQKIEDEPENSDHPGTQTPN